MVKYDSEFNNQRHAGNVRYDNGNDTDKGNQKHADIDTGNAHSMFALCRTCHNPCLLNFDKCRYRSMQSSVDLQQWDRAAAHSQQCHIQAIVCQPIVVITNSPHDVWGA